MQTAISLVALLSGLVNLTGLVYHCLRDKRVWAPRSDIERIADHAQTLEMRVAVLERK